MLRKFGPVCLKPVLIPFPPQSPLSLPPSYPAKSTQNPPFFKAMSESSRDDTSENSQEHPSLNSSEERLVRGSDAPSPTALASAETERPPEAATLTVSPARFEEGKAYSEEEISEARRLCDLHNLEAEKTLTDWQFAEQCQIGGLDRYGKERQLTDDEIHAVQQEMDRENVLARTRAMYEEALAREAESAPSSRDSLQAWWSPRNFPPEARWNHEEIRDLTAMHESGLKYDEARDNMRAALEDLLEAEESFRAECKRQRKPVLESPYSYADFSNDVQARQRYVRLGPHQALEYAKHRDLCQKEGRVAADSPVLQLPVPEDQMPPLTDVDKLPPELVHAAHVLVAMGCDSQTTPREAARMLVLDSFRTMGLENAPWPWVHKTDYHMDEESELSRAIAAMPGPIFNCRQMGRRLSRLQVQEGPLVQCMHCEQFFREAEAHHVPGGSSSTPPMTECFEDTALPSEEAASRCRDTPSPKRLKRLDSSQAVWNSPVSTPPAEAAASTLKYDHSSGEFVRTEGQSIEAEWLQLARSSPPAGAAWPRTPVDPRERQARLEESWARREADARQWARGLDNRLDPPAASVLLNRSAAFETSAASIRSQRTYRSSSEIRYNGER